MNVGSILRGFVTAIQSAKSCEKVGIAPQCPPDICTHDSAVVEWTTSKILGSSAVDTSALKGEDRRPQEPLRSTEDVAVSVEQEASRGTKLTQASSFEVSDIT